MPQGYLLLILHAHLPYVRHPEYDDFLEEDWLYEAITETYIPLLEVFDGLERDGVDWRLTMSVTPTLAGMLSDPLLQYRYVRHIDNLIALAGKELERTRWQPEFHGLAQMYHDRFCRAREVFVNQYGSNLCNGFRRFFDTGKLELITCGATHGFLPSPPLRHVPRPAIQRRHRRPATLMRCQAAAQRQSAPRVAWSAGPTGPCQCGPGPAFSHQTCRSGM